VKVHEYSFKEYDEIAPVSCPRYIVVFITVDSSRSWSYDRSERSELCIEGARTYLFYKPMHLSGTVFYTVPLSDVGVCLVINSWPENLPPAPAVMSLGNGHGWCDPFKSSQRCSFHDRSLTAQPLSTRSRHQ
jgi:hypothetical protein